MEMLMYFLIPALYAVHSQAQIVSIGPSALPPGLPPPVVISQSLSDAPTSSSSTKCEPGDFIPGPTCTSFYMCVGNLYAARKVKFQCAPGTIFNDELNVCVHGYGSKCLAEQATSTSSPSPVPPPAPAPPPAPVPFPGQGLPPAPAPGPSLPSGPAPPPAPPTETCSSYELDKGSIYECLEPGTYPSFSDCSRFYKCIVTMSCIIKGFMFRCPSGYLYDTSLRKCETEEIIGVCDRLADPAGLTTEVTSVVELTPEVLDQFFKANVYWQLMPFLPEEPQKIVPIKPSSFSRGSSGTHSLRRP